MNPNTLPKSVKPRKCIDCLPDSRRSAPHPGPRCATHHRGRRKDIRANTADRRLEKVYSITREEYNAIKAEQGNHCICGEWTGYNGATRALSVDHDHLTGFVRGALCKHCNDLLGRVGDDPRYFELMANYLRNPPAFRVIGQRVAQGAPRRGKCSGLSILNEGHYTAKCGDQLAHAAHDYRVSPGQTP